MTTIDISARVAKDLSTILLEAAKRHDTLPRLKSVAIYFDEAELRAIIKSLEASPGVAQGARDCGEAREKEITRLATIEECARVAEAEKLGFLSPEYASNQPFGSFCERFACDQVAEAIRALAVPSTYRCAACGCQTRGEVALVDGKEWCQSCADAIARGSK